MSMSIAASGAPALRKLTVTEAKLLWRTPAVLFWAIAFPLIGLLVLGLIPGTNQPEKQFGGASVLQTYLPVIIAFTIVMTAVNFLPVSMVMYRERGILRRMSTTPVRPSALLGAQVIVNVSVQVVMTVVVVVVAVAGFGASIRQPAAFAAGFVLVTAALSALGLLVAAVCSTGKAASAVGSLLFFVLMFFGGLWWPRSQMPGALRHVSDVTPLGAGVQTLQDGMAGQWAHPWYLAVLAGYVIICGVLATRLFRWE
jgi:ABC-2 type transport system permease protein